MVRVDQPVPSSAKLALVDNPTAKLNEPSQIHQTTYTKLHTPSPGERRLELYTVKSLGPSGSKDKVLERD
jgi:hypothetical protein